MSPLRNNGSTFDNDLHNGSTPTLGTIPAPTDNFQNPIFLNVIRICLVFAFMKFVHWAYTGCEMWQKPDDPAGPHHRRM